MKKYIILFVLLAGCKSEPVYLAPVYYLTMNSYTISMWTKKHHPQHYEKYRQQFERSTDAYCLSEMRRWMLDGVPLETAIDILKKTYPETYEREKSFLDRILETTKKPGLEAYKDLIVSQQNNDIINGELLCH